MRRVRSAAALVGVSDDLEVSDAARGRVDRPTARPRAHACTTPHLLDNSSCHPYSLRVFPNLYLHFKKKSPFLNPYFKSIFCSMIKTL